MLLSSRFIARIQLQGYKVGWKVKLAYVLGAKEHVLVKVSEFSKTKIKEKKEKGRRNWKKGKREGGGKAKRSRKENGRRREKGIDNGK